PNSLSALLPTPTSTTTISNLSLHDALPICSFRGPAFRREEMWPSGRKGRRPDWRVHPEARRRPPRVRRDGSANRRCRPDGREQRDRKSTRLNSSHLGISYAVFCWKNIYQRL